MLELNAKLEAGHRIFVSSDITKPKAEGLKLLIAGYIQALQSGAFNTDSSLHHPTLRKSLAMYGMILRMLSRFPVRKSPCRRLANVGSRISLSCSASSPDRAPVCNVRQAEVIGQMMEPSLVECACVSKKQASSILSLIRTTCV